MSNMPNEAGSRGLSRINTFLANHTDFLAHADTTTPANTECPICLEDVFEHICVKIVGIQGCKHMIGLECLQVLLNSHPNDKKLCPLCRTEWLSGSGPGIDIGYDSDSDDPYDPESDYDNRYSPDIRYSGGFGPNTRSTGYVNRSLVDGDAASLAAHAIVSQSLSQQNHQRPSYLGPRMTEYLNDLSIRGVGSARTTHARYVPHGQRVPGYTYNGGSARGSAHGSLTNQQAGALQQTGGQDSTSPTQRAPGPRVEATSRYGLPWPITGQYGLSSPPTPPFSPRRLAAHYPFQPTRYQHGSTAPPLHTGIRPLSAQPSRRNHSSTAPQHHLATPPPAQPSRRQHISTQPTPTRPPTPNHARIQQAHTSIQTRTPPGQNTPSRSANVTTTRTAGQIPSPDGQSSSSSSARPERVTTTRTAVPNPSVRREVSTTMTAGSAQCAGTGPGAERGSV